MPLKKLKEEILSRSHSLVWEEAKKEWTFINSRFNKEGETCLCGHSPIKEICHIFNSTTQIETEVGNVCVNRFMGIESEPIFVSIRKITKTIDASISPQAVNFFYDIKIIDAWEKAFCLNILSIQKKRLTQKQILMRQKINLKILKAVSKKKEQDKKWEEWENH